MNYLEYEDVKNIHFALVEHFVLNDDPINPPGVRSPDLLHSAVERQRVGWKGYLKYIDPRDVAATLVYGIVLDHPFHNGNKRTGLVVGLAHLERNGYMPKPDVKERDIYKMILGVAQHLPAEEWGVRSFAKRAQVLPGRLHDPDAEVSSLGQWFRRNMRVAEKKDRSIRFHVLKKLLRRHSVVFGSPDRSYIDVFIEEETVSSGFLGLGPSSKKIVRRKVGQIKFDGESAMVPVNTVRLVRQMCSLRPEDGVDARVFYDLEAKVDHLLCQYQHVLRRLANR